MFVLAPEDPSEYESRGAEISDTAKRGITMVQLELLQNLLQPVLALKAPFELQPVKQHSRADQVDHDQHLPHLRPLRQAPHRPLRVFVGGAGGYRCTVASVVHITRLGRRALPRRSRCSGDIMKCTSCRATPRTGSARSVANHQHDLGELGGSLEETPFGERSHFRHAKVWCRAWTTHAWHTLASGALWWLCG